MRTLQSFVVLALVGCAPTHTPDTNADAGAFVDTSDTTADRADAAPDATTDADRTDATADADDTGDRLDTNLDDTNLDDTTGSADIDADRTDTSANDTGDRLDADADDEPADTADAEDTETVTPDPAPRTDVVAWVGGVGLDELSDVHRLSDGTLLVGGRLADAAVIDPGVPRITLDPGEIDCASTGNTAVLIHLAGDLQTVLHLATFPTGTVRDVLRIRSTEAPGEHTGAIYISGSRDTADVMDDGYFIARLNQNFVDGTPTGLDWIRAVSARPRRAGGFAGESHYKLWQPWDVGGDGRVVYGSGAEYDYDWAQIGAFNADGTDAVVEHWPVHWTPSGEARHVAASSLGGAAERSGIVLKAGRGGSLRSHAQADFDARWSDGNGRTDRPGRWPDDMFFAGPCDATGNTCAATGGHTGYRTSDKPTQRLGGVAIDRHTNRVFFGYSTQSRLPDGNPDFEPAVVAMDADGSLLWWNRLYPETGVSTPDQYVDGLAFDHTNDRVIVLARAHGNNVVNFWSGDAIAADPAARGFQNSFTGTEGNIHISWLGAFEADSGTLRAATWVAELVEGLTGGVTAFDSTTPLLEGQPNPNAGWPNLNTTRCRSEMAVLPDGAVAIVCTGRRTITTRNALQQMPGVGEGVGSWNEFVRVYEPDLRALRYSSLLTGVWDAVTGEGGGNTTLAGLAADGEGVLVVGTNAVDDAGVPVGNNVPVTAVPAWAEAAPSGRDGLIAYLRLAP